MSIKKALTHLSFARAALIDLDENTYGEDFGNDFASEIIKVAVEEIGNGEVGGNNSGPHVAKYKSILDDGDDDDDGAWCAAFISWVCEESCRRIGADMPFKRSQGAKQLFKRIKTAGRGLKHPEPGCVVVWDRGKLQKNGKPSWAGHIGLVESVSPGVINTIEGNVGAFPSRVRRFKHDLTRETKIEGYAAFPDLDGVLV